MTGKGRQLVQCLKAVSAYGKEVEALCETLCELMVKEIGIADLPCKISGDFKYSERTDNLGYIFTDMAYSFPLMGKSLKKSRAEMYLSFQISFIGKGMLFVGNEEPLLHVSLWTDAITFESDYFMIYPLELDEPCSVKNQRLLAWVNSGDDWKKNMWTFSIQLLTLDSSRALIDRIVKPAIALLKGESVTSALPDDLPGLVFYSDEKVLYAASEMIE